MSFSGNRLIIQHRTGERAIKGKESWDFQAHINHWINGMRNIISSILQSGRVSFQSIRLLLGWLWLHEVGALASSLHQKAKAFLLGIGKTVVTIHGYAIRTGLEYLHSENRT